MRSESYYMLSFDQTTDAMDAEQRLSGRISLSVMPTLRAVTAACGISLRVERSAAPALNALLRGGLLTGCPYRLYAVDAGLPRQLASEEELL